LIKFLLLCTNFKSLDGSVQERERENGRKKTLELAWAFSELVRNDFSFVDASRDSDLSPFLAVTISRKGDRAYSGYI
jgi:hypothetical protein